MLKKTKIITLEELSNSYAVLIQAKKDVINAKETLYRIEKEFDKITNKTSAKVLAEWARTEAFTEYI